MTNPRLQDELLSRGAGLGVIGEFLDRDFRQTRHTHYLRAFVSPLEFPRPLKVRSTTYVYGLAVHGNLLQG
jgi:hypothetical protein